MRVVIAGMSAEVRSATLELYHLESSEFDWNLSADLEGPWPLLQLSGTGVTASLPAAPLRLAYIDAPDSVNVDGVAGGLTNGGEDVLMRMQPVGDDRVRVECKLVIEWYGFESGSRAVELEVDLEAAVTRR